MYMVQFPCIIGHDMVLYFLTPYQYKGNVKIAKSKYSDKLKAIIDSAVHGQDPQEAMDD